MGNTSVLWPEVEVENSGSRCAHEMQIEIKPAPETRRSAARLTEAKLGNALLETHGIQSGSRLADSPNYPPLANQARISGDVVIDKTGSVVEMKLVSGPPPLIPAALAAARTWRYEPTYLNDEPIDIQFILTVRFELQN